MVLADTSVWISHFRSRSEALADLLMKGRIFTHSFVAGELACGNLKDRALVLSDFHALPAATHASDEEVMSLLDKRKLYGRGLGWTDAHLLASALLSGCRLWTFDKSLARAAETLKVSAMIALKRAIK